MNNEIEVKNFWLVFVSTILLMMAMVVGITTCATISKPMETPLIGNIFICHATQNRIAFAEDMTGVFANIDKSIHIDFTYATDREYIKCLDDASEWKYELISIENGLFVNKTNEFFVVEVITDGE